MNQTIELKHCAEKYPLATALINHSLTRLGPQRQPCLLSAYWNQPDAYFRQVEAEVEAVMQACGRSLPQCLQDMDAFNALTPETENDAWYEQPAAFTSMHLDALLLGFSRRRLDCVASQIATLRLERAAVLDVGSGSGRLAAMLLDQHPGWHAMLVDRSRAAIRFSSAYLAARGSAGRALCRDGDIVAIPAVDATFDIVIAAEVLEHAADPQASAAELLRVLKPGGCLVVSLPIDLDIAMHPTVFTTPQAILGFFEKLPLEHIASQTVAPDSALDAITDVFPDFEGCFNAMFRYRGPSAARPQAARTGRAIA